MARGHRPEHHPQRRPVSAPHRLRIPHEVADLLRGLHPVLKRKVRAALEALLRNPREGKALRNELQGLRSYRVGRFRIIYRVRRDVEVVAFGPRDSIYLETYRQLHEPRGRYRTGRRPEAPDPDTLNPETLDPRDARPPRRWTPETLDPRDAGPLRRSTPETLDP